MLANLINKILWLKRKIVMNKNKEILFPYYSGNIYNSLVLGHVTIEQFIHSHKYPKENIINIINKIKIAKEQSNEKLKRELKQSLYSFTPSVYINLNKSRKYENVLFWTGLMQLDFDKIPDIKTAIEIKEYVFNQREIICSYISPSGTGVKALMKIKKPKNKDHYKAIHKAMVTKYEELSYLDLATNNAMLPLFLSIDTKILSRNIDKCITWTDENWNKVNYIKLNDNIKNEDFDYENEKNRTLKILKRKIETIVDNGHPQVRSAALILGSRVAAGYLDIHTAQYEIENLIKNNNYLTKGISGYLATALWGISEGHKTPKYYD
jgi:hypothetical protein